MTLQGLEGVPTRSPKLEQYPTPAAIASDVLWTAFGAGHLAGRSVADLGCGNGVFAIGAKLLGAAKVLGVDIDAGAVATARRNAEGLGVEIEFHEADVKDAKGVFETVLQNPPFGAQTKHADRVFIEKAVELAPVTYSLHNDGTQEFVAKLVQSLGGRAELLKKYKFEIPYAFEFHRKATETVSVVLLRFER
jgi:putative methylase